MNEHEDSETLGRRIVFARERSGFTTAQLARRLGVKTQTLASWERDETEPRSNRLIMMAQFLGVSAGWLLEGISEQAPEEVSASADLIEIRGRLVHVQQMIASLSNVVDDLLDRIERISEECLDESRDPASEQSESLPSAH